jgi:hypothetical protein
MTVTAVRGLFLALSACVCAAASTAEAAIQFDQNVTGDVIFGSGNTNGSFTTDRDNGIELGLRAKVRFPASNTFLSNHNGTYGSFATGGPGGLTPTWSFEWSINSDFTGLTGNQLDDFRYQLRIDSDPSAAKSFLVFDPIHVASADHAIGNNATGNGDGIEGTPGNYASLISSNNLAQNSWRMDFFTGLLSPAFNPAVSGIYTFELAAYGLGDTGYGSPLARTRIDVIVGTPAVVPEPASLAIWGLGAVGIAIAARRKRKLA